MTSSITNMEVLTIQYEIDFEYMFIKFFVVLNGVSKGYGVKLKYKGLYDNNTLEKFLKPFVENAHSTFTKHLNKSRGSTSLIKSLSKEDLDGICTTVLNNYL